MNCQDAWITKLKTRLNIRNIMRSNFQFSGISYIEPTFWCINEMLKVSCRSRWQQCVCCRRFNLNFPGNFHISQRSVSEPDLRIALRYEFPQNNQHIQNSLHLSFQGAN